MKKFLLCMLLAGLMMPVVAQEKQPYQKKVVQMSERFDRGAPTMLPINLRGTLVDIPSWIVAGTSESYDRQTQGGVYPMTKVHDDDAFIACTWTTEDNNPFPGTNSLRGIGYAYSTDKGKTWSDQENRLGGLPVYWPSYAQWGKKGEAFMARSYDSYTYEYGDETINIKDGVVLFTRETRGEGEWTITPVPYPEGIEPDPNFVMAWGQMTTSGEDHQYIHIICPLSTGTGASAQYYHGYSTPMLYYRTLDGKTWEVEAVVVAEMLGEDWEPESYYADALSFAVQGNTIACSFVNWGSNGYVIRSHDNGENWESIKFFDSPVLGEATPADYADTIYIPTQGCLALDNNGKMHIAFSVLMTANDEQPGYLGYFMGLTTTFLSYWNEDMDPIDGDADYRVAVLEDMLYDYFDWDLSTPDCLYVISTVPQWPLIGYYTPNPNSDCFSIDIDVIKNWAVGSYGLAGCFSFPQMEVDKYNVLHLAYLGLLDSGDNNGCWLRHPYYTSYKDGDWTETEYLVNTIDLIDFEFAYLTSAGLGEDRWYLMAQVDVYPGVKEPYSNSSSDHGKTTNSFTFFPIMKIEKPVAINELGYTPLTMSVYPNPAAGQATVEFEGKGNVTMYNMLGQTVYHAENVENSTKISLNDLTTGVYFVTVRSGNATATQKLIVK